MKNQFSAGPEDGAAAAIRDVNFPVFLQANYSCFGKVEAAIVGFDERVVGDGPLQFLNGPHSTRND